MPATRPANPPAWLLVALVALIGVALTVIRLTAPSDLMAYAQDLPAMNILDVVVNGQWLSQRDAHGSVMHKPPVHTWLAAVASLPFARAHEFSIRLPSALATIGAGLLILGVGRARFGWRAGLWAAVAYFLSRFVAQGSVLIRTDTVFALAVTLTALAAFRAWQTSGGWVWFWLAAAATTLTKGPLGVILAGAGLLAVVWERRSGHETRLRGRQVGGLLLFLLLVLAWFLPALWAEGWALFHQIIVRELLGHAVWGKQGALPGEHFYAPTLDFLGRFAPWSVFACVGLWRVATRPAAAATERQFERFLCCWFAGGLVIFSLAAHVRPDLLSPLLPAAALLSGRELARFFARARWTVALASATGVAVVGLAVIGWAYHAARRADALVVRTEGMRETAAWVGQRVGEQFPLTYVDRAFALQFYLNTMRVQVPVERAAELLKGTDAAFVVVRDFEMLRNALGDQGVERIHELWRWPASGEIYLRIVSNRPQLEWSDHMVAGFYPFVVRFERTRLLATHGHAFVFDSGGAVTLTNISAVPQQARVYQRPRRGMPAGEMVLAPQEDWRVELSRAWTPVGARSE